MKIQLGNKEIEVRGDIAYHMLDDKFRDFEKYLNQQQFELELKHSFHWIERSGRWIDKRGMVSSNYLTNEELNYLFDNLDTLKISRKSPK